MPAVYLNQPWLECGLADNLEASANQFSNNIKPSGQQIKSLDGLQNIGYFFSVAGKEATLDERINRIITSYLASCNNSFADCLLILASTSQKIQEIEKKVTAAASFKSTHVYKLDLLTENLQKTWGFASSIAMNTACTSAANGLIYGARLVKQGVYKKVLVIAYETPSKLTLQGFGSLGLNSASGEYCPFHLERDGLILGEAYTAALLTQEKNITSCAQLLGGASGCDTSNMTSTLVDGIHIHTIANLALKESAIKSEQIQLIKHHGTGTGNNDIAEAAAVERIFSNASVPSSCILKPWLGHTLGACGLAEVVLMMYCISNGLALPGLNYSKNAITSLPSTSFKINSNALVMANFSGFGGNNASLILKGAGQ